MRDTSNLLFLKLKAVTCSSGKRIGNAAIFTALRLFRGKEIY